MAYDNGLAEILRDALAEMNGITERKMFGGLCFMWNGNMLCGVHAKGGMARVGKDQMDMALAIDGVDPPVFHRSSDGRDGGCCRRGLRRR